MFGEGLRIWPLYYFFLVLCFLLTLIPASFIAAPLYPGDLFVPIPLKSYFFMAIFLFNFNIAGSMLTNPSAFMTQLWSISVEEQFYLFWPWIARYRSAAAHRCGSASHDCYFMYRAALPCRSILIGMSGPIP